ncbi:MAG: MOSC domain-containing protein [Sphingobacteriales bacterium]|nr:MAG: MOSC domain-containing protein [Sphingobacteriales bacterium]
MNKNDELILSGIYIYPIKSLGGISLQEAKLEQRGLQYDRRWLLIDEDGVFITQRKHFTLAMLQVEIEDQTLTVLHKKDPLQTISFKITEHLKGKIDVTIWDDYATAYEVNQEVSEWFSDYLNIKVRLVVMPDDEQRFVDERYANHGEIVTFADAYPCLIIGQSSLNQLNTKLAEPVLMDRFRPNFVFTGGEPHLEDEFKSFRIGKSLFSGVKLCARCVLTTVDQQTGVKGQEPLRTLAGYRTINKKVMFGQNLLHEGTGTITVGDRLVIDTWKD